MEVWVFGNPDLAEDAVPLSLLLRLRELFPRLQFVVRDPQDEWPEALQHLVIIDTVQGLKRVQAFTSLTDFAEAPRVTMHDFDLGSELRLREKLGKLPPFVVLGVPPQLEADEATRQLQPYLAEYAK